MLEWGCAAPGTHGILYGGSPLHAAHGIARMPAGGCPPGSGPGPNVSERWLDNQPSRPFSHFYHFWAKNSPKGARGRICLHSTCQEHAFLGRNREMGTFSLKVQNFIKFHEICKIS